MTTTSASTRVADLFRQDIASGRLQVGDRLPTRREICERYGIAAMTAARVIRILADEGLVVSDVGRGVFVTATAAPAPVAKGNDDVHERVKQLEARVAALEAWRSRSDDLPPS